MTTTAELSALAVSPIQRLTRLCDAGSLRPLLVGSGFAPTSVGWPAGGLAASGQIKGQPVVCWADDPRHKGGSLGVAEGRRLERALEFAGETSRPMISLASSAGARLHDGADALACYGRVFRRLVELEGRVPRIAIVSHPNAGGSCYGAALGDFVIMTPPGRMYLTGPKIVRRALGEDADDTSLGGPKVHRRNGVCDLVAASEDEAFDRTRRLLGHLLPSYGSASGVARRDPSCHLPESARQGYDIRSVIADIADDEAFLELCSHWATNMVTGFCRLGGLSVGIVANQPARLGGLIDSAASEKGARFVERCDSLGLPLVVLVDTPGFMPGIRQEGAGVIRYGAAFLRAFCRATVPRFTVVLRKAFGGAFITMNSKALGADRAYAWPEAQIGIMAAEHALSLVRKGNGDAGWPAAVAEYASEHVAAAAAERRGHLDQVIDPADTAPRLHEALVASYRFGLGARRVSHG